MDSRWSKISDCIPSKVVFKKHLQKSTRLVSSLRMPGRWLLRVFVTQR